MKIFLVARISETRVFFLAWLQSIKNTKNLNNLNKALNVILNIVDNEESFIALILNVVNEEFTKQATHMTNIVSSNLSITNQELGTLRNEISESKLSLEFTENILNEKMAAATN